MIQDNFQIIPTSQSPEREFLSRPSAELLLSTQGQLAMYLSLVMLYECKNSIENKTQKR